MAVSSDADDSSGQLHRYINHLLIELHESQRQLIQARFVGHGESEELRRYLQSDIISLYWTLNTYQNRADNAWENIVLYEYNGQRVRGLDQIRGWTELQETVEVETEDFSNSSETVTQPKILPSKVLIESATAIAKVADKIGFNAKGNDQRPFQDWGEEEYDDGV